MYFFTYVCVHVYVLVHKSLHMYVYVWKPEDNLLRLPQERYPLPLRSRLLLPGNSPVKLYWLTSESRGSSCFEFPSVGIAGKHHYSQHFYVHSGDQTLLSMLARQALCPLRFLSSPTASVWK